MDLMTILIGLAVLVVMLLCYYGFISFVKRKPAKEIIESQVDIKKLVDALGGEDNIIESNHCHSKLSVHLKDSTLTNVDVIRELGASGIVEGKDSFSMIFGKVSEAIDKDLHNYLNL